MRIRMKISVNGTFHNIVEGVRAGDVVDVDDDNGERYISLGYAELADQRGKPEPVEPPEEHAVAPSAEQATKPRPSRPKSEKPADE